MFQAKEKGISLYIVFMIMALIFTAGMGLSILILSQFRIVKGIGDSVVAFYGADTGVEEMLQDIKDNGYVGSPKEITGNIDIDGSTVNYRSVLVPKGTTSYGVTCPLEETPRFCIFSQGAYKEVQRAIRVRY